MKTNTLAHKAVLIRLSAGAFIGNPRDNALTAEVEHTHGTGAKLISVRKKIMQGAELNKCAATLQELRVTFERLSAPWLDGGLRIVPSKSILAVKTKIEEKKRDYFAAVENFVAKRDEIMNRDNSPQRLNGAWRASDYPTMSELRAKFYAELEVLPVQTDFRCEIDSAIAAEIESEAERMTAERIKTAKADLLARAVEKLTHLAPKLAPAKEKERFHDSNVTNVADVCEEIKAANFDEDAALDRLVSKVQAMVKSIDIEAVKADEAARADAKQDAEKALADVQKAMQAFA